jgi:hypothetical protein
VNLIPTALCLAGLSWSAAYAFDLPADVSRFIEQRRICDHFRGEPHEGDARQHVFVQKQQNRYCAGTDARLVNLRRRYLRNAVVQRELDGFEPCIEAKTPCRPGKER